MKDIFSPTSLAGVVLAVWAAASPAIIGAEGGSAGSAAPAPAGVVVHPQRASDSDERTVRTFQLTEGGSFDLQNIAGSVTLSGGKGRELRIEALEHVRGSSRARVDIRELANRVEVRTYYEGRQNRSSVDYQITVPSGIATRLRTISGTITVQGVDGDLDIETVSGELAVSGVKSVTALKTVSGDLTIERVDLAQDLRASTVSGTLRVRGVKTDGLELTAVSGDIDIADVTATRVKAGVISGNITFGSRLRERGRYAFNSHSGNITIDVDDRTGFELNAQTFSGNIQSDLPLTTGGRLSEGGRRGQTIRATFGNGSAVLDCTTFSGNVWLRRRQ